MNEYAYDEIEIGMSECFCATITAEMMDAFLLISGDTNPLHCEEAFAQANGHPGRVVYGLLTTSLLSRLAGVYLPGVHCLLHRVETEFPKAVYIGDVLTVQGVVQNKSDSFQTIDVKATITNQNGEKVCRAKIRAGVTR